LGFCRERRPESFRDRHGVDVVDEVDLVDEVDSVDEIGGE
jgi:hypothetical protein